MTSTYYLSYHIRKSNGQTAWLRTPHFETEADIRPLYELKIRKPNVIDCCIFRKDHYQPEEMRRPENHPHGFDDYRIIASYCRI